MPGVPTLMDPRQPFHEWADMFLQLTMAYHKDKVSQTSTYRIILPMHFQNLESSISFPNNNAEGGSDEARHQFRKEGKNEMDTTCNIEVKSLKRSSSNELSTSSASPIKCPCTKSLSSICAALQDNKKNKQWPGLLRYFNKATEEEHHKYIAQMDEEMKARMDDTLLSVEWSKLKQEEKKCQYQKEKKHSQRARLKNQEIMRGLRSPGGTKWQVKPF